MSSKTTRIKICTLYYNNKLALLESINMHRQSPEEIFLLIGQLFSYTVSAEL